MRAALLVGFLSLGVFCVAHAQNTMLRKLPAPEINDHTWVLVEVWPDVKDITLSAYFLDFSSDKNSNLCQAVARALDRDQAANAKNAGRTATSYRKCFALSQAVA